MAQQIGSDEGQPLGEVILASPGDHDASQTQLKPVIIIGAGMAGLTAARRLKEKGIPVLVLEGRGRLGGRTHTIDVAGNNESWADMGAAWVDDHLTSCVYTDLVKGGVHVHPTPLKMSDVKIYDQKNASWKGWVGSAWSFSKYGWNNSKLQSPSSKFKNLGERVDAVLGKNPNHIDKFFLANFPALANGGSADTQHQNASSPGSWEFLQYKETSSVMITGGYKKLVDFVREPLSSSEVLLDQAVSRIFVPAVSPSSDLKESVWVETSDGRSFEGSHVIVTAPIGVLKAGSITFDPPLPASKQDVIERMGSGSVEKMVMTFNKAFWQPTGVPKFGMLLCVPDPPATWGMFADVTATAASAEGAPASPCLACVCGSKEAEWASEHPDEAIQRALSDLKAMFPDTFEAPLASACSSWSSSPFTMGCYAYPSPATQRGDFAKLGESTHEGRVLFAGDAYGGGMYMGSVQGAMQSGERAADAVCSERMPHAAADAPLSVDSVAAPRPWMPCLG